MPLRTSLFIFLYLHNRLGSPILSLAIVNNVGAILNSRELIDVPLN